MKTAAAYIRVSTDDQIEYSPDSQLKAIRKYAKDHDMILPNEYVFVDEGISGRTATKRPEFNRMIGTAKLKPKPFDTILLWKFSRFARNRQDSIVYKSMLRKQCGIDVVSVSEQLGDENTSILIEALIEAMDEYYSLNLAEEVKRGMNEKFSRGGVVSQPPFGYRMGGGIFVADETNAPIVRMIYSDYLSGMGARQIATKLNNMGITTLKGNPWENRTIEYILTNPTYLGKMRRSKDPRNRADRFHEDSELVDAQHEPLISAETFEAVQSKRSSIKKAYGKYARHAPVEFMLKGLVRCDSCGATLILAGAKSGRYLQCHQYNRGSCHVSHGISVDKINGIVINKLRSDFTSGDFDVIISSQEEEKISEGKALSLLIERERKKLDRVKEAYEAGIDTLDEYRANKAKIQNRIDELQHSIEDIPVETDKQRREKIRGSIKSGLAIMESPDLSETTKNETLRTFVDSIIFIKSKQIVEINYKA